MLTTRFTRFVSAAVLSDGRDDAQAGGAGQRLFEHFISETHAVAVGVAVAATAANALQDWRVEVRPAEIARFAPDSAALRTLHPLLHGHGPLDEARATGLNAFLDRLDIARAGLDVFLDECEQISAVRATSVHARHLQSTWRVLARDTKGLIADLEHCAPEPLPERYEQNRRVISALLSGAANGLKPCLDDARRLYVPPLPQRRRTPRRAVLQNCVVRGPHHLQTGFVRDASAGGLGLGRVSGLKRGDRIRVDFASGRQFSGTVAWVTDSSAGMRFDQALAATDSLIAV